MTVETVLGFSPTATTPADSQRLEALIRAIEKTRPSLAQIPYDSDGSLLVIGPQPAFAAVVESLPALERIVFLDSENTDGCDLPKQEKYAIDGREFWKASNLRAELNGHLGAFNLETEPKLSCLQQPFALALDLQRQPLISDPLLPPGYYAPKGDHDAFLEALEEIPLRQGHFEKPAYIMVNAQMCAHQRNSIEGCSRCIDACPASAFSSSGDTVEADQHRCHGVGVCRAACPSGAIQYSAANANQTAVALCSLIAEYEVAPQIIFYHPDSSASVLADLADVLPAHCLYWPMEEPGATSPELWLSAIAGGAGNIVILIDQQVPDSVRSELEKQADVVNHLLAGVLPSDSQQRVRLIDDQSFGDAVAAQPKPLAALCPPLTYALVGEKRELIHLAMDYLVSRADRALIAETIELPAHAAFGALEIDVDACTLCVGCVSCCPAQALSANSEEPKLQFVENQCLQCGLCVEACPESALQLKPRYLTNRQQRIQHRTLKQEQPFTCIRCAKPFATRSMVDKIMATLADHVQFQGEAKNRLMMCEDCRVKDMM